MRPFNFRVTNTKPATGEIYTENFYWYDYETPKDLRLAVAIYCNESVDLGWDVLAIDDDSKVIFVYTHDKIGV